MTLEQVLELIEVAKTNGEEEITVNLDLDDAIVTDLSEEHNMCIFYSCDSWVTREGMKTIISWNEDKVAMSKWAESLGGNWYYGIIYHDQDKYPYYGIHEIIPKKDGTVGTWTARAHIVGDSVDDIKEVLRMMLEDVEQRPVINESETDDL